MSTEKMHVCLTGDIPAHLLPHVGKVELGREVERLRLAAGLRQADLGPQAHISNIERGRVHPDAATLKAIAGRLKVPVSHFAPFGGPHNRAAARPTKRQRLIAPQADTKGRALQEIGNPPTIPPQPQQSDLWRESEAKVFQALTLRSLETVVRLSRLVEEHRDIEVELCAAVDDVLARYDRPKSKAARDA